LLHSLIKQGRTDSYSFKLGVVI